MPRVPMRLGCVAGGGAIGPAALLARLERRTGIGSMLRADGTVRVKANCVGDLWHGRVWYYDRDGAFAGEARFTHRVRLEGFVPPVEF